VVAAALQEDVDVLGLSFLTWAHKEHTLEIMRLMRENGLEPDEMVFAVGGIIPPKDVSFLKSVGVDVVFGPGSDTREIARAIGQAVLEKKGQEVVAGPRV
jgi:methylmalonyl-CoA mutase C-terminal domain/subunit